MTFRTVLHALLGTLLITGSLLAQPVTDGEGDVGIGTLEPDPSAILDLTSTAKGLLLPRMTSAQRDAIPDPATGLLIYNTEDSVIQWNFGSFTSPEWYTVVGIDSSGHLRAALSPGAMWYGNPSGQAAELPIGGPGYILAVDATGSAPEWLPASSFPFWALGGNASTSPSNNYIGTSDDVDFVVATNGVERARFYSGANGGGIAIFGPLMPAGDAGLPGDILVSNGPGSAPSWTTGLNLDSLNVRTLVVQQNAMVGGDFDVDGNTTLDNTAIDGTLSSTGNTTLASAPGATTTIGTGSGTVDIQGSVTSISTTNINPAGGQEASVTIGYNDADGTGPDNPSTTTINGNVNIGAPFGDNGGATTTTIQGNADFTGNVSFANLPSLPLSQNALYRGDNTGHAAELSSTNDPGAILQQDSNGTPIWDRNLDVNNVEIDGSLDVIGPTSLTELDVSEEATFDDDVDFNNGEVSINGSGFTTSAGTTSTFNGPVNINNDVAIDGDLSASGDVTLANVMASNASIGNPTGNTTIDGSTITIGNGVSSTTIDGNVTFVNAPKLPLTDNAIFVGGAQGTPGIAEELPTTNIQGSVLQQDANGKPVWSRDLDVDNLAVVQNMIVDGSTTLGDGNDDITIYAGTGNVTLQDLINNSSPGSVVTIDPLGHLSETSIIQLGAALSGTTAVARDMTLVGDGTTGNPLGMNLGNANSWTAQQTFSSVDINGGTIDGTPIGVLVEAGGRFTFLRSSGTTQLGDGDDNVTINTGGNGTNLSMTGLAADATPSSVLTINASNQVRRTTTSDLGNSLSGSVPVAHNMTLSGNGTTGDPLGVDLTNPNSWTGQQTFSSVDINGGAIDGTAIGTLVEAGGRFTFLRSSSTTQLGDGDDNVTINTGGNSTNLSMTGIAADATPTSILTINGSNQVRQTSAANLGTTLSGSVAIAHHPSLSGDGTTANPLAVNMAHPNNWTSLQTFSSVDINGGTIDGTAIGTSVEAGGRFTFLRSSSTTQLGDGDDNVTINTGGNSTNLSMTGIAADATPTSILTINGSSQVRQTSTSNLGATLAGTVPVAHDMSLTGNGTAASPLGIDLANPNSWTGQQTFSSVDINGGTIDGTPIGISVEAGGRFTFLRSSGTTQLGDGNDNISINTGTGGTNLSMTGIAPDAAPTTVLTINGSSQVRQTTTSDLGASLSGTVPVSRDGSLTGNGTAASPLGVNLGNANNWTAQQTFSSVNIGGGTIDGTIIGGNTSAAGFFTDLTTWGNAFLGDGNDNVSINVGTGELTVAGVDNDATPTTILTINGSNQVRSTSISDLAGALNDQITVETDGTLTGDGTTASPLGVNLSNANSWTGTQTFATVDINGGEIDGTAIGANSPAAASVTTFTTSGGTTLGNGDDNITLNAGTGTVTLVGATSDPAPSTILTIDGSNQVRSTSLTDLATSLNDHITVETDGSLTGDGTTANPLGVNLSNSNTWTAQQNFTLVDIDGGTIDGTEIGNSVPAAASVTTFNASGNVALGDGDDNVNVNVGTGNFTLDGIDNDSGPTTVLTINGSNQVRSTSITDLAGALNDQITVETDGTLTGDGTTANPLGVNLTSANTWTGSQTFTSVDINGGTVDNVAINGSAIGTTTPAAASFTTLNSNDAVTLGDGNDNITLNAGTGEIAMTGVATDAAPTTVLTINGSDQVRETSIADLGTALGGNIAVNTDASINGNGTTASPLSVNLANPNTWTAQQTFSNADVNGGTIDGTVIGGTTPAAATVTTFTSTGATTIGDGNDNITLNAGTGNLSLPGIANDGAPTTVLTINGADQVRETSIADLGTALGGNIAVNTDASINGNGTTASPLSVNLANPNTWTAQQTFSNADVNGGTIDGVTIDGSVIGGTTAAAATFTNLTTNGNTTLGNGDDNVTINTGTGNFALNGITTDASPTTVLTINGSNQVRETSITDLQTALGGTIAVSTDASINGNGTAASPLSVNLANPNAWTAQQTFADVDVNGGTIDGTAIGTTTAAAGSFTTLNSNGATTLGDGDDNVTINTGSGNLAFSGIATDGTPTTVLTINGSDQVRETSIADLGTALGGNIAVNTDASINGDGTTANPLSVNLGNANTWTAPQTFNTVDVNGGTIDGTVIGGTTPAAASVTTFNANGTTTIGDGDDNVTINAGTGNLALTGIATDAAPTTVLTINGTNQVRETSIADLGAALGGDIAVATDGTISGDGTTGAPLSINLSNANTWTAQQSFNNADINGGTIDGTVIGGTTAAAGSFTTLNSNGATTLGNGDDNITLNAGTGEITMTGVATDASPTTILTINGANQVRETSVADFSTLLGGSVTVATDGTINGDGTTANPLGVNLGNSNSWTAAQTFASVDINGGTIDGTVIGGTTPAAATVTNLTANGTTTIGDGDDNVTINTGTGNFTLTGIATDASPTTVLTINGSNQVRETSLTDLQSALGGTVAVATDASINGNGTTASPLSLNLGNANNWTATQTFADVDVNGGAIDGTVVGGTTPAAASVTTFNTNGATTLGDGDDNIALNAGTGQITMLGVVNDATPTTVLTINGSNEVRETSITDLGTSLGGNVAVATDLSINGDGTTANPLSVNLANPNTWTATQTFADADINGGSIDGTVIGATTAAAGSFTTLSTSSNTFLGDGNGDTIIINGSNPTSGGLVRLDVTNGILDIDGITQDNALGNLLALDGNGNVYYRQAASLVSAVATDSTFRGSGLVGDPYGVDLAGDFLWTGTQTFTDLNTIGDVVMGDGDGDNITLDVSDPSVGGTLQFDVTNGALDIDGLTQDNTLSSILVTDANGVIHTRLVGSLGGAILADSTLVGDGTAGTPLGIDLTASNLWTGEQTFTNLNTIGTVLLGDGNGDNITVDVSDATAGGTFQIDVTNGALDIDGLTQDNTQTDILVMDASGQIFTRSVGSIGSGGVSTDSTILGDGTPGTPLGIDLGSANSWTGTQTFATANINGGAIDGVTIDNSVIGGTSPAAATFTTTTTTGATTLGDGDDNVTINTGTGEFSLTGIANDATPATLVTINGSNQIRTTSISDLGAALGENIAVATDASINGDGTTANPLSLNLANANNWTAQQTFANADINGGTIDGVAINGSTIGATTPAAATVTTFNTTGATTLGDGNDNVTVNTGTGNLTFTALATDAAPTTVLTINGSDQVRETSIADLGAQLTGTIPVATDASINGDGTTADPLSVNLANPNNWSAQQTFANADINGGTIDGVAINGSTIGAATPAAGTFTAVTANGTFAANGTTTLGDGDDNVTINTGTGNLTLSGLTTDAAATTFLSINGSNQVRQTGIADIGSQLSGMIPVATDASINGDGTTASPLSVNLANANNWTAQQTFTNADINGGTIDGTVIGGTTPAAVTSTSLTTTGTTTLGNGDDNITLNAGTGSVTLVGAANDATPTTILTINGANQVTSTSVADLAGALNDQITVETDGTLTGDGTTANPLGVNLGNANNWTAQQTFANADINGGTIDGVAINGSTIGGTTPAAATVTTFNTTGATTLGNGDDNIALNAGTGEITMTGVATDAVPTTVLTINGSNQVRQTGIADLGSQLTGTIPVATDASINGNGTTANPLSVNLANANSWTAQQTFANVDVNGGTIDGTVIGGASAAAGTFTDLTGTGNVSLGNGDDNVTINTGTGNLTLASVATDAAPTTVLTINGSNQVRETSVADLGTALGGTIAVNTDASINGNGTTANPLSVNLGNPNTWTALQTFATVDINGGTVDGVAINGSTIGATTPAAATVTTFNSNGATTLGNGDDNITLNAGSGEITMTGVATDAAPTTILTINGSNQVRETSISDLGTQLNGTISVATDGTIRGNGTTGDPLGIDLTNANNWTAQQTFANADINGGTIDGTVIGGTSPAAATITTLSTTGATTLGNGDDNITLNAGTGTVTLIGATNNATPTTILTMNGANGVTSTSISDLAGALNDQITVETNTTLTGNGTTASPLGVNLANANSWTAQQTFANADINGGTIDGVAINGSTIGATTPASATFTTLNATGNTTLGNGDDNVTVNTGTGNLTFSGIATDGGPTTILTINGSDQVRRTSVGSLSTTLAGTVPVSTNTSLTGNGTTASPLGVNLANANNWTAQQGFTSVDIDGGTIDGTVIGGTSAAAGTFTTVTATGNVALGNGDDNVTVNTGTGNLTFAGIAADAAPTTLLSINGSNQVRRTTVSNLATSLNNNVAVSTNATLTGNGTTASPLGVNLTNPNTWTGAQTFSSATINGGAINGTSIGGTTPSTAAFTTLSTTGNATLGDGNDNITMNAGTGQISMIGVAVDNTPTSIVTINGSNQVRQTSTSTLASLLNNNVSVSTNATLTGNGTAASPLGVNLANANSWTAQQTFSSAAINGGTIDGTTIGGTVRGAGSFTTLNSNGNTTLGDGNDNITLDAGTGQIAMTGMATDAAPTTLVTINASNQLRKTGVSSLATALNNSVAVSTNTSLTGNGTTASPLGINLANPNNWTGNQTFSSVTVNGGTMDGTTIGGTTPALGRFTTLRTSGLNDLGDGVGVDDLTISLGTGTMTVNGLATDATPTTVMTINASNQVRKTTIASLASSFNNSVAVSTNATLTGNGTTASPLGVNLANPNNWTGNQTFSSVTVNGGTIEGTAIGGVTPALGRFTTFRSSGINDLGDGVGADNTAINLGTGDLTLNGVATDNSPLTVLTINNTNQVRKTGVSSLASAFNNSVAVSTNATLTGNGTTASPLGVNLANANNWTAQQTFNSAVVNGGTIDGTAIGGTTAALGRFTTLRSSGTNDFGDGVGADNLTVNLGTGTMAINGLGTDATPTTVMTINASNQVQKTAIASLASSFNNSVAVSTNATLTGNGTTASPLGVNLANANSWTGQQTFNSVVVNGGTIDGTAIGGTTPALGRFTTLRSSGTNDFGDGVGADNLMVNLGTGTMAINGLGTDATPTTVMTINGSNQVQKTAITTLASSFNNSVAVATNATLTGNGTTASPLGLNLANANSWSGAQTFSSATINGGSINNTAIGATTKNTGGFTTLISTGNTTLGDGDDNITLNPGTGQLILSGLSALTTPTQILTMNASNQVRTTTPASLATQLSGSISVSTNATLTGNGTTASPLGLNLANANSWTGAQTFSSATVNGGAINATPIGATTRSTAQFTTLNANGSTVLGDGNGDNITLNASDPTTGGTVGIDVTNGTLGITGLTQNNTATNVLVIDGTGAVRTRTAASLTGSSGWSLTGNSGTSATTNFLGTTDAVALVFRTSNTERMRIGATGNVGIGSTNPGQKLEIQDGNILLSNSGTAGEIRLAEPSAGGTQYTAFKAGLMGSNIVYTLPTTQGADGTVLGNDGSGNLSWANPNQNGSIGSEQFARKTADESLTNSTTLQNDDHLSFAVSSGKTYKIEGFLYARANSNNPEIKIALVLPTGSTMKVTYVSYDGANNIKGGGFLTSSGTASSTIDLTASTTTDVAIWIKGVIITGSNSGDVQLQWAMVNNTGGTQTITVEQNSFLELARVE